MIEWLWIWALLAWPLPWLLSRVGRRRPEATAGAIVWPYAREAAALGLLGPERQRMSWWLLLGWSLLCLAAMRPVTWSEWEQPPVSGRELMLAVDVSGSMAADDMEVAGQRVDRLTAVKVVLGDFLDRRAGDRVGLILFGQQAYLLTPLTFDRDSVRYQLETSAVGIAGRETAIGDAIGLAVKRLRERPQADRVLVLLTDGVNTAGALTPEQASRLASEAGIRVHTVAMGSDQPSAQGLFGMMLPTAAAEIDEASLRRIAGATGGRFFRARDTRELANIYAELDRLEPVEVTGQRLRRQQEQFIWPLGLALLVIVLGAAWRRGAGRVAGTVVR